MQIGSATNEAAQVNAAAEITGQFLEPDRGCLARLGPMLGSEREALRRRHAPDIERPGPAAQRELRQADAWLQLARIVLSHPVSLQCRRDRGREQHFARARSTTEARGHVDGIADEGVRALCRRSVKAASHVAEMQADANSGFDL